MLGNAITNVDQYYNKIKKDKGGNPYSHHLGYIREHLETEEEQLVAMFHSVLEDQADIKEKLGKTIDEEELRRWRLSESVINSIKILTRRDGEDYNDYINRIINSGDINAIKVKYYALEDNLNIDRISDPKEEDIDNLLNKCKPNYEKLRQKMGELDDRYQVNKGK